MTVRRKTPGWIALHRPDGEVVYVHTDHIVFVMSATMKTGAHKHSRSKLQLTNGYCDVRENVEEVMQTITAAPRHH